MDIMTKYKVISARDDKWIEDEIEAYVEQFHHVEVKGFNVNEHGIIHCLIEYSNRR